MVGQNILFVSAENGLIVRDQAGKNANRIGKFDYAEAVEVLEKVDVYIEIIDDGETINGQWYKVTGKSIEHETLTGYVFSGFLTKTTLKETVEFVTNNDDADYWFISAKKNDSIQAYYYHIEMDKTYLRGDLIDIIWKKKTLIEAGDEDITHDVKWIVSTNKNKDGNVSMFRKQYPNKLQHDTKTGNYVLTSSNKIYLDTEYYIANTTNKELKNALNKAQNVFFSVEDRHWNDKAYTAIHIYHWLNTTQSTLQWLFIAQETGRIYEYYELTDSLKEFK